MLVAVMIVIMIVEVVVVIMMMMVWKVSRKRRIEFEYSVQFCPLYIK